MKIRILGLGALVISTLTLGVAAWGQSKATSASVPREIPLAAQSVVSSSLGNANAAYRAKSSPRGYATENPANKLSAHYTANGVDVNFQNKSLRLQLQGWGYGNHLDVASAAIFPNASANRIEYRRGNLIEWYVNGPLGIEQGFTISRPRAMRAHSSDALNIALRLRGDLVPSVEANRRAVTLRDPSGKVALRYAGLVAYDASGRELKSWMVQRGGLVDLRVDTTNARYPVIVDPFMEVTELEDSSAPPSSLLGASVAMSGDGRVVVAGACGSGALNCSSTTNGAAYVFLEPQNGWATAATTQPAITLTSGLPEGTGDGFGYAVAISGDGNTIVVSAPQYQCSPPLPSPTAMCEGKVFVFTTENELWPANTKAVATLAATDGAFGDSFGAFVATDSMASTIVAVQFDVSSETSHLNLYLVPLGGWASEPGGATENAWLQNSDVQNLFGFGDGFGTGTSISADSSTIIAGANAHNSFGGEAYVFVEPSGGWSSLPGPPTLTTETVRLQSSDNSGASQFGWSNAVDQHGDTIVVGALEQNQNQNSVQSAGEAYVFVKPSSAGGWAATTTNPLNETTRLEESSPVAGDSFGDVVSVSGDGSTIGVGSEDTAAYLFTEPNAAWPASTLNSPTRLVPAYVNLSNGGFNPVVSGETAAGTTTGTVLVSVPGNNNNSGAVFVYSAQSATCPTVTISPASGKAIAGTSYSQPFSVPNSTDTFNWTATATPSDDGLTMSSSGQLSGTPTDEGTYTFSVTAKDTVNQCAYNSTFTLTVTEPTTTTIQGTSSSDQGNTFSQNETVVGTTVTVNFQVQPQSGTGTPTGTVTVTASSPNAANVTCGPMSLSAGSSSCPLTFSSPGTFTLTAQYTPDTTSSALFAPSTSGTLTEIVAPMAPCGSSSTSVSGAQGSTANGATNVCVGSDVNATPTASIQGCPPNSTCSTAISGGPGVYKLTLTLDLRRSGTGGRDPWVIPPGARPWILTLLWVALLFALTGCVQRLRQTQAQPRRSWAGAYALLIVMLLSVLSACSSVPETPVGTYTVNVDVTAGNFTLVVPFQVTVTK